jgi:hypothetical protein
MVGDHTAGKQAPRGAVHRAQPTVPAESLGGLGHAIAVSLPDHRDRLRGQPGAGPDGPVRPVRVRLQDTAGGGRTVGQRQRQSVGHVGVHSKDKGAVLAAVIVPDRYLLRPAGLRGAQPVHPVDDPHAVPVDHDGGQAVYLREGTDVIGVLTGLPGRVGRPQRAEHDHLSRVCLLPGQLRPVQR